LSTPEEAASRLAQEQYAADLTPETITAELEALGKKPNIVAVDGILDRIGKIANNKHRNLLFAVSIQVLTGQELKRHAQKARSTADKNWKARAQAQAKKASGLKVEKAQCDLPLPDWGVEYGKHKGRTFVFGRPKPDTNQQDDDDQGGDDGVFGPPLHSALHIEAAVTYPDRIVEGEPRNGVRIKYENRQGEIRWQTFTHSQALHSSSEKMISDLCDGGVSFEPAGIEVLKAGILSSGLPARGDVVFDYPGWRKDGVFLTPDGKVIGEAEHTIELAKPLSQMIPSGTLEGWCEGAAAAFFR
jgi:hypothetical protein